MTDILAFRRLAPKCSSAHSVSHQRLVMKQAIPGHLRLPRENLVFGVTYVSKLGPAGPFVSLT